MNDCGDSVTAYSLIGSTSFWTKIKLDLLEIEKRGRKYQLPCQTFRHTAALTAQLNQTETDDSPKTASSKDRVKSFSASFPSPSLPYDWLTAICSPPSPGERGVKFQPASHEGLGIFFIFCVLWAKDRSARQAGDKKMAYWSVELWVKWAINTGCILEQLYI